MSFLLPELDLSVATADWILIAIALVVQVFLSIQPNPLWGVILPLVSVGLGAYQYILAVQMPRGEITGYVALATYVAAAFLMIILWGVCRCMIGGRLKDKRQAQISAKKAAKQKALEEQAQRAREIIAAREAGIPISEAGPEQTVVEPPKVTRQAMEQGEAPQPKAKKTNPRKEAKRRALEEQAQRAREIIAAREAARTADANKQAKEQAKTSNGEAKPHFGRKKH